jgi:hypothetical protein
MPLNHFRFKKKKPTNEWTWTGTIQILLFLACLMFFRLIKATKIFVSYWYSLLFWNDQMEIEMHQVSNRIKIENGGEIFEVWNLIQSSWLILQFSRNLKFLKRAEPSWKSNLMFLVGHPGAQQTKNKMCRVSAGS